MEASVLNECERQCGRVVKRTDFRLKFSRLLFKLCYFLAGEVWVSYSISMPLFLHLYNADDNVLYPKELMN